MKKKILIIAAVVAFLALLLIIFVPRDVYIVTTTSSFISSDDHYYITNPIFRFKMPVLVNKPDTDTFDQERDEKLAEVRSFVLEHDPEAFAGEHSALKNCFFEHKGFMYYYRTEDIYHFYRMSQDGEIKQYEFAKLDNNDEEQHLLGGLKEVDSNFVSQRSIQTEGLIEFYQGLQTSINRVEGDFYSHNVYISNDRIFFVKKATIYEYKPGKGVFTKVASVKGNETIDYIIDSKGN